MAISNKKIALILISLIFTAQTFAQNKSAEDFGFRHFTMKFRRDTVDILIKSKKGDELKPKPLFLFCQGSLPIPLILYDEQGMYGVFPFNTDSLSENYHIAIIGKPYIPIIAEAKTLGPNYTYVDKTGVFPKEYSERNLLSYYVDRNIAVIKYLQKQEWISKKRIVVAGHSEGSTIAAKLACSYHKITHLIYAGGNPLGRIMSIIEQNRAIESDSDSTRYGEDIFKYWQAVVANSTDMDASQGDTYMATYEFSQPPIEYLEKLHIPILVAYGTKDWSAAFNDYLRTDVARKKKDNFTFKAYIGAEHNFFPVLADGKPNYDIYNWDKVALDWYQWLKRN